MGLQSGEAIILDVFDLQEYDRIVVFLTREQGKKRGVANGARRKYSRFAGQIQPLAKVQAAWFEKEGRELVRLSSVDLIRSAEGLNESLEGILLGAYLADQTNAFSQDSDDSELSYRLLNSTVEALLGGCERDLAARYFESWILRLAGVLGISEECPSCGRVFSARTEAGGALGAALPPSDETLVCSECAGAGGFPVSSGALEFLDQISRRSLAALDRRPPPAEIVREMEELNGRIRRTFLQRELNSYRIMRQTLSGLPAKSGRQ